MGIREFSSHIVRSALLQAAMMEPGNAGWAITSDTMEGDVWDTTLDAATSVTDTSRIAPSVRDTNTVPFRLDAEIDLIPIPSSALKSSRFSRSFLSVPSSISNTRVPPLTRATVHSPTTARQLAASVVTDREPWNVDDNTL